ncbi:uncharacterized protein LOC121370071 [Gigantopelta aegis]|uniref:uncharacterized protein LOC121370071 n=1 Tax=Gigantopelta aegis TaxID=1735272 RepID=UPI001B88BBBE|nr:uncharacterized protein LOC121370071 [Gigantopelta aegis]
MAETATANVNTTVTFRDFVEYDAAMVIWQYVPPFLILTGTVGSILSVFVLARKKLQSVTSMLYLVLLAVTDIFVLNTGLLRYWVNHVFGYDMRLSSSFSCKFHTLMVYLSLDYSTWVVVMLTLDRCISVCLPFRTFRACSIRNARVFSVVVFLLLFAINMHYFWTYDLVERTIFGDGIECYAASPSFKVFIDDVWPWIDLCVVCGIPFAIMIVCNVLIVRQLIKSSQKVWAHKIGTTKSSTQVMENSVSKRLPLESDQQLGHLNLSADSGSGDMAKTNLCESKTLQSGKQIEIESKEGIKIESKEGIKTESKNTFEIKSEGNISKTSRIKLESLARATKRHSRLTVMMLSINCVFLLLMSPIAVYMIGFGTWKVNPEAHDEAVLMLAWAVVNMLQYTNNSIHFFLIYLTVPSFRRWFLSMCKCRRKLNPDYSASMTVK